MISVGMETESNGLHRIVSVVVEEEKEEERLGFAWLIITYLPLETRVASITKLGKHENFSQISFWHFVLYDWSRYDCDILQTHTHVNIIFSSNLSS